MSKTMNMDELADFVKTTTLPVIKEQIGSDVANIVRENIEKVASDPNSPWGKSYAQQMLSGQERKPEPIKRWLLPR